MTGGPKQPELRRDPAIITIYRTKTAFRQAPNGPRSSTTQHEKAATDGDARTGATAPARNGRAGLGLGFWWAGLRFGLSEGLGAGAQLAFNSTRAVCSRLYPEGRSEGPAEQ